MMSLNELTKELDSFYYDADPHLYFDDVKSREEGLIRIKNLISDPISASKCLQDILDMDTEDLLPTIRQYDGLREALSIYIAQLLQSNSREIARIRCRPLSRQCV